MRGTLLALAASGFLTGQTYSTYLRAGFAPSAIAADAAGNLYLTGSVRLDPLAVATSVLVIKLNPQATEYVYVSQVNGLSNAHAGGITVDGSANVWVTGQNGNQQSFVAKLDPSGEVLFSAGNVLFLADGIGGSSIALDAAANIFVSGNTDQTDYPTTPGAYQTGFVPTLTCVSISPIGNCFRSTNQYVTKLDPAASKLLYSTGINGMDAVHLEQRAGAGCSGECLRDGDNPVGALSVYEHGGAGPGRHSVCHEIGSGRQVAGLVGATGRSGSAVRFAVEQPVR